MSMFATVF